MDLVMPGMNGVEATGWIKQISPRTQVVVLTSYHEDEYIFPALRAGALGYILKDISSMELAETIRKAARGDSAGGYGNGGGGGGYGGYSDRPREMFTTTCDSCGKEARVPFRPTGSKPVYCSDCFRR